MTRAMISRSLAVLALSAASVACSSPSASPAKPGADGGGSVGCSGQGDTYTANLTRKGTHGYTFTLVQSSPAPPAQYQNVWTLKVTDASGAPPSASQLDLYPYMTLMGHGSDQTPTITSNGDGTFTVKDVYLFMQGLWTLTLSVVEPSSSDGGPPTTAPVTLDSAVYKFCID